MSNKPDRRILQGWDVLVIEDDMFSMDIARMLLEHHGATVHTAENGAEGLEKLAEMTPRFIISDISMPVMDGWEFIQNLRSDPHFKEIPAIALTAHAMMGDRERAMAAGYHNYLSKPLSPATFMHELLVLLVDIPDLALDYAV